MASLEEIDELRRTFESAGLDPADLAPDPATQYQRWYDVAARAGLHLPDAVALATATPDGRPSVRFVLLRQFDDRGFCFFTDGRSAKVADLLVNPLASLALPWHWLQRQVRISGTVRTVPPEESDAYFASRPRGSQIGAWASHQSAELIDRAQLEAAVAEAEAEWDGRPVERPPYWGGFRIVPDEVEFWQGRANRLHDRYVYRRAADGWTTSRLSP